MESAGLGRETMQDKKDKNKKLHAEKLRYAALLLTVLVVTAGCTKKEELLFVTGEIGETVLSAQPGTDSGTAPPVQPGTDPETAPSAQPGTDSETAPPAQPGIVSDTAQTERGGILVHVCGAVLHAGVYELKAGSRVYEAVEAAGGFAADADQNYVNQAQTLKDGVKLVIPTMEEAAQAREREPLIEAAQGEDGVQDGRININTATAAQLCDIPGVGATRAAAIIAYRESHGGVHKPEDIMKVDGIKEGMYEKIKDSISVN